MKCGRIMILACGAWGIVGSRRRFWLALDLPSNGSMEKEKMISFGIVLFVLYFSSDYLPSFLGLHIFNVCPGAIL